MGLGLSKGLIELHGGTVCAQSDGEGKGSRIVFSLPACSAPSTPKQASIDQNPDSSWRVLIIEDNVDAARTLASLLRLYGHVPRVAHCGAEGLQAARAFRPDIVLCDIGLPGGMDGYGVAHALRNEPELQTVCLIAITGYAQHNDVQQAKASGFDLHMTKPVDPAIFSCSVFTSHQCSFLELIRQDRLARTTRNGLIVHCTLVISLAAPDARRDSCPKWPMDGFANR